MTIYTVHARNEAHSEPDPLRFVFIKEGFCWPALFFGLPWVLLRGLWATLILYLVSAVVIAILGKVLLAPIVVGVGIVFALWFALEANQFRRWELRRRYRMIGIAEGRNLEEAEARFFTQMPPVAPVVAPAEPPAATMPDEPTPPVVGLFPQPGSSA